MPSLPHFTLPVIWTEQQRVAVWLVKAELSSSVVLVLKGSDLHQFQPFLQICVFWDRFENVAL